MPSLITDPGVLVMDFPVAVVETKDTLDDESWSAVQHLYCDRLTLAVNAYDEAELAYELGDVVQPGDDTFAQYNPLNLIGKFVRITIPQEAPLADVVWVGYIVGTANQRSAVKQDGNPANNKLTGRKQILTAVGLEYFLDRVQIDGAVVFDTNRIFRSIPFNGGQGVSLDADTRQRSNRSDDLNADGVYVFVGSGETGALWTNEKIIVYLLEYFTPRDSAGNPKPITYRIDPVDVLAAVLDGIAPTLDPEGMTPFQVLNKLLSPQRGFVWWAEYVEPFPGNFFCNIRVETLATAAITLPAAGTIPANRDQQTLDFDGQRDVEDVIVAEAGSRRYHQFIVRGARMTSTATFGVGELLEDWTSAIETEYKAAVSSAVGEENDAARKAERFYRVYSAFRIDPEWDGKTGDGDEGARNWTFPVLSPTGSILASLPFSIEGLRLLNHTRIKRGWDYEGALPPTKTTPAGTEAEYMPLFAVFQVGASPDKYQFADKMRNSEFEGSTPVAEIATSYNIHAQQNVPGVILNSHGLNHTAALNHWSGAEASTTDPEVDYDTLRVTCTIEADSYCEGRYPLDADLPEGVPLEKLVLYVGDEYRLDFLAANTVVDLEDGDPVLTSGGILRDDRKSAADIARVAFEWYSLDHLPLTVRFKQLRNLFRLGMMITTIGEGTTQESVNTVVSMISYDLLNGITEIKTNDDDLDFVRVA